jgi:lipopolysaccharide transport system permease protein
LDLRKRYRRSVLGLGWALVQPAAMALVLCGVFSGAFDVDFREHFPYVLTGLCLWGYLSAVVREGCGCIFWSESYIRQHRAPMAIYPLRIVLAAAFHLVIALLPIVIFAIWSRGVPSIQTMLFVPAVAVLLLILGWSLATVLGMTTVYLPDMRQLSEVGMQVLFYATPIIYRADMLRGRRLSWIIQANPAAALTELVRLPLLEGSVAPSASVWLASGATAVVVLLAVLMLSRFERRIIFHL